MARRQYVINLDAPHLPSAFARDQFLDRPGGYRIDLACISGAFGMLLVSSGRDFSRLVTRIDDRREHRQTRAADHGVVAECAGCARERETEHRHRHNQFGPPPARSFILMLVVGTVLIIHVISSVVVMLTKLGRLFGSIP